MTAANNNFYLTLISEQRTEIKEFKAKLALLQTEFQELKTSEKEAWRYAKELESELAARGPRWTDGGVSMADALGGL